MQLTPKLITHMGLMISLAFILHQIRIYHMPQGGSITLGSMVPLLFLSFCYGPGIGFLTGFLYGVISLLFNPYILHPVQVLFDYPLPYMAIGLAGYFPTRIFLGTTIAVLGRFICHFISGIVFFASYAPEGTSPYLYAFLFNASYLLPELMITLFLFKLLPLKNLMKQVK
ncbi:energy-coupled thiamine transporter ThiT [Anaerosinus sp.]|uniref:energy-coupled thiamine transporter ThiT n=1 Tax=Selenobaculum sp. TaxID=3074374 RepID=UPI003AB823AF